MRIVAGNARGRRIAVPKGLEVRPTTDRVREALFSSLGRRVIGAGVLDLFAGTGALGLESLSRGATFAVFVEQAKRTRDILIQNIARCGFQASSRILGMEAVSALRKLRKLQQQEPRFDLVFLDPPYAGPMMDRALSCLAESPLLGDDVLIVAEHPADNPPTAPRGLEIASHKRYGKTILSFVQRTRPIR